MFCRFCGEDVPDHSKFCLSCGRQVDPLDLPVNRDAIPVASSVIQHAIPPAPTPPAANQTQPVPSDDVPDATQRNSGKYSNKLDDHKKQEEKAGPKRKISTGKIVGICMTVLFFALVGISFLVSSMGKGSLTAAGSTTEDPSYYAGNPVIPTESTETSEAAVPIVDSGEEYKIDINSIANDYEKVVVSSFGADGTPEEYDISGSKQDGDRIILNISDTEAISAELDNIILKDTDNSVNQTNSITNTIYNFDSANINNMGNMKKSTITAASYKTINGVPYLLCMIDGTQSLIPFNDITLSAKISMEDINAIISDESASKIYEIIISTGTEVKIINNFKWCNIIQMEDGTRLLDACAKDSDSGEYFRYLTLESNCMYLGVADEIISGEGITKLGNEGSNIDFNNAGDNLPITEENRKVIDSYISADGFVYVYVENGYGTDSKYLQYKIPADKVAFLNSNNNIPVGSTKTDLSQYKTYSIGQKDFSRNRVNGPQPFMLNVEDNSFYYSGDSYIYNMANVIAVSELKTAEEINANYPKIEGDIDFSFSQLGATVSDYVSSHVTAFKYVTYKEVTIEDQQFYSIVQYLEVTDDNGEIHNCYFELLANKDSVTIKANESSLSLTA